MGVISGDSVIERGFAKIAEGQVHYRQAGAHHALKERPLVMIHAFPGSAKTLEPLVAKLGVHRWVIALDTLGNGTHVPRKHLPSRWLTWPKHT